MCKDDQDLHTAPTIIVRLRYITWFEINNTVLMEMIERRSD